MLTRRLSLFHGLSLLARPIVPFSAFVRLGSSGARGKEVTGPRPIAATPSFSGTRAFGGKTATSDTVLNSIFAESATSMPTDAQGAMDHGTFSRSNDEKPETGSNPARSRREEFAKADKENRAHEEAAREYVRIEVHHVEMATEVLKNSKRAKRAINEGFPELPIAILREHEKREFAGEVMEKDVEAAFTTGFVEVGEKSTSKRAGPESKEGAEEDDRLRTMAQGLGMEKKSK